MPECATLNSLASLCIALSHAFLNAGSLGNVWKVGKILSPFFRKLEDLHELTAHFMIEDGYDCSQVKPNCNVQKPCHQVQINVEAPGLVLVR